jgi:hypothetical protein
MEISITQYIESTWGIIANLLIFIVFGLASYNTYAKRWSAKSGHYYTTGRITWSENYQMQGQRHSLVSYSYTVDGTLYNGEIYVSPFRAKKIVEENPKGKELTVYYSKKDPGFSKAYKPPNHLNIIGKSVIQYLLIPTVLVNIVTIYFYWLINASK